MGYDIRAVFCIDLGFLSKPIALNWLSSVQLGLGLMVLVRREGGIEAGIGENARLCMGVEVRTGNGLGTCGQSPHVVLRS